MNIKIWKQHLKRIWDYRIVGYNGKYLNIDLQGGLCNKLHSLFSACDIVLKEGAYLIEPFFGWNERILFSDIYDLNFFNKKMSQLNNGKQIMISRDKINDNSIKRKIITNCINLWEYSENELETERNNCIISKESTKLRVLKALKLIPEFDEIVKKYVDNKIFTAIQIRTEYDWVDYSKRKVAGEDEVILVSLDKLIKMISDFNLIGDLFFTSGENHKEIIKAFKIIGLNPLYFFNPNYEYEINSAINFEICCQAYSFIGLSRSSYSNLISLKRAAILENDYSFIYNFKDKILQRIDKGLQPNACLSITKETHIS